MNDKIKNTLNNQIANSLSKAQNEVTFEKAIVKIDKDLVAQELILLENLSSIESLND